MTVNIDKEHDDLIQDHYTSHSVASYEKSIFYSQPDYVNFVRDEVWQIFGITADAEQQAEKKLTLLDVGGGTGTFTKKLMGENACKGIVLEPFLPENTDCMKGGKLTFVKDGVEVFLDREGDAWRKEFNLVLVKEAVHHFDPKQRKDVFEGIRTDLVENCCSPAKPNFLIITRPQYDFDYPLWEEARRVWAANQPPAEEIADDLVQAGFCDVECKTVIYPCNIFLKSWLDMIKSRTWSTFSHFSDKELNIACDQIRDGFRKNVDGVSVVPERIRFEDRLIFITARSVE